MTNVLLTYFGIGVVAMFSWAVKRWLCHRDKDKFMKRKKRIIDEICAVTFGVLVFSVFTSIQFSLRVLSVTQLALISDWQPGRLSLANKLILLSLSASGLFIASTALRTPLAKIDKKLTLEHKGEWVPDYVNIVLPKHKKSFLLLTLSLLVFGECGLVVDLFVHHIALLR